MKLAQSGVENPRMQQPEAPSRTPRSSCRKSRRSRYIPFSHQPHGVYRGANIRITSSITHRASSRLSLRPWRSAMSFGHGDLSLPRWRLASWRNEVGWKPGTRRDLRERCCRHFHSPDWRTCTMQTALAPRSLCPVPTLQLLIPGLYTRQKTDHTK